MNTQLDMIPTVTPTVTPTELDATELNTNELNTIKSESIDDICNHGTNLKIEITFINACINGDISNVMYILGHTPIHPNVGIVYACRSGQLKVLEILLQLGANPNHIDKKQKNWTPILATMIGNNWNNENKDAMIDLLMKYGGKMEPWIFERIHTYNNIIEVVRNSNNLNFEILKFIF